MSAIKAALLLTMLAVAVPTAASGQLGELARPQADLMTREEYGAKIAAHLSRHKRYPKEARERKLEGRAVVTFVIDAQGSVISVSLQQTSGVDVFDREAAEMVRRAAPFPPPPHKKSQQFTVPVSFRWIDANKSTDAPLADDLSPAAPPSSPNSPNR